MKRYRDIIPSDVQSTYQDFKISKYPRLTQGFDLVPYSDSDSNSESFQGIKQGIKQGIIPRNHSKESNSGSNFLGFGLVSYNDLDSDSKVSDSDSDSDSEEPRNSYLDNRTLNHCLHTYWETNEYYLNQEYKELLLVDESCYKDLVLTKLKEKYPCGKECFEIVASFAELLDLTSIPTITLCWRKAFHGHQAPLTDLDQGSSLSLSHKKWNAEHEEHLSKEKGYLIAFPVEKWSYGNRTCPCDTPHPFSFSPLSITPDEFWTFDNEKKVNIFTKLSSAKQYDFVIWIQKVVGSFSKWLIDTKRSLTCTSSSISPSISPIVIYQSHRRLSVPLLNILQRSKEEFGASWSDLDVVNRELHMSELVACLKKFLDGNLEQKKAYFSWLSWLHWWIPDVTFRILREKDLGALSYYLNVPDNSFWLLPVKLQVEIYYRAPTENQKNIIHKLGPELGHEVQGLFTTSQLFQESNHEKTAWLHGKHVYERHMRKFFGIVNQKLFHDRCHHLSCCPVGWPSKHLVNDQQFYFVLGSWYRRTEEWHLDHIDKLLIAISRLVKSWTKWNHQTDSGTWSLSVCKQKPVPCWFCSNPAHEAHEIFLVQSRELHKTLKSFLELKVGTKYHEKVIYLNKFRNPAHEAHDIYRYAGVRSSFM